MKSSFFLGVSVPIFWLIVSLWSVFVLSKSEKLAEISSQVARIEFALLIVALSLVPVTTVFLMKAFDGRFGHFSSAYVLIFVAAVTVIFASYLFSAFSDSPALVSAGALFYAAVLASFGWIYTNAIAIRSMRYAAEQQRLANQKAHTMHILINFRSDPTLKQARENLFRRFGPGREISEVEARDLIDEYNDPISWSAGSPPGDSLRFILNYYEYICAGIRSGDLNYDMVYHSISSIILGTVESYEHFIAIQKKSSPEAYVHLLKVCERFEADDSAELYNKIN